MYTVPVLLAARADDEPARVALRQADGVTLTFGDWRARAATGAAVLRAYGVNPGDRVGLLCEGWAAFAVAFAAVTWAGAAAVPLSAKQPAAVLAGMLDDCGAAGLVRHGDVDLPVFGGFTLDAAALDAAGGPLDDRSTPDGLAQILYTSGTTGRPKGVSASHANVTHGHSPRPRRRAMGHSEVFAHAFPIGTNAAQMMLVNTLTAHPAALVAARFEAETFAAMVAAHRAGTVFLVPTMAIDLLESGALHRYDMSGVRLVNSSAAALPPAVAVRLAAAFPDATLVNNYTSTEAVPAQTVMVVDPARPASVGRPTDPRDLRITGPGGEPLPAGEVGEVWLRSPGAQRAYYGDPAATARVFTPGWTRMGDVGYLDDDGYLHLVDRESDVVKSGGLKVSTLRVEAVLHEHPSVAEACVVGLPHPTLGTLVAAAVVVRDSSGAESLRGFARERLARHETPARWLVVPELPRNDTGKVVKPDVRRMFAAADAAPGRAASADEEVLAGLWRRVLGRAASPDDDFFALGGDSLKAGQLAAVAGDHYGVELAAEFVFDTPVLAAQAATLAGRAGHGTSPGSEGPVRGVPAGGRRPLGSVPRHWWRWLHEVPGGRQMPPVQFAVRVRDRLDLDVLDRALVALAARHDALRTTFAEEGGSPVAVPGPAPAGVLERADAVGATVDERLRHAGELAAAAVRAPFDLHAGPPWRALAIRVGEDDTVLVVAVHHLVCDGWSSTVLVRELALLYSAGRVGATAPLPVLAVDAADHVAWEIGQWADADDYWARRLAGAPSGLVTLPGRRTDVSFVEGDQLAVPLGAGTGAAFRALAGARRMSLAMAVAAAWAATLAAWSGSDDLVMAQPVSGRTRPEFEPVVGCLFRWVLLRLDTSDASFTDLLGRVRTEVLGALAHQHYAYDRYHRAVGYPAFFRFDSWGRPAHLPGLASEPFEVPAGPNMRWPLAPGDLDRYPPELLVAEQPDGELSATLIFNTHAYERAGMADLAAVAAAHWAKLLDAPDRSFRGNWPGRGSSRIAR